MNVVKCCRVIPGSFKAIVLALIIFPLGATAAIEQTFDVLKIGTHTYKNVTVTTKAKNYIFIMHSAGLANITIADLPPELLEKLGYAAASDEHKATPNASAAWAQEKISSLASPQVKQLEQ